MNFIENNKIALIVGGVFGFVAPFTGLGVTSTATQIFMFPVLGLSALFNTPFGMWSRPLVLFGCVLSAAVWALIFGIISMLIKYIKNRFV